MGNKLGFTKRRQGLYVVMTKDMDMKKLQKLMFYSQFAHRNPVDDKSSCRHDLEECPICFLYYGCLNTSRCCKKRICTDCFLRIKDSSSAQPPPCPFCKTSNYAVYSRGRKTKEEKSIEQTIIPFLAKAIHAQWDGQFDFDLEDKTVLEAISLSMQEPGIQRNTDEMPEKDNNVEPSTPSSSSQSGGLGCAIAVLAECQQIVGESSSSQDVNVASYDMVPGNCNNSHYNGI